MPEPISLSVSEAVGAGEEAALSLAPDPARYGLSLTAVDHPGKASLSPERLRVEYSMPPFEAQVDMARPVCGLCLKASDWDQSLPWRCRQCGGNGSLYFEQRFIGETDPKERWLWLTWDARFALKTVRFVDVAFRPEALAEFGERIA